MSSSSAFRIYCLLLFSAGVTDFIFRPLSLVFLAPACLLSMSHSRIIVECTLKGPWIGALFGLQLLIGVALIWLGGLRHFTAIVFIITSAYCAMMDWLHTAKRISIGGRLPECNKIGEQ
jgi:hypothetical protein